MEKLTIALPVLPQSGLMHIASAKGYFAAAGLDVTLAPVSHGKVGLDLVLQGKVDLTVAAEVPFTILATKGEPLSIVLNMLEMPDGHGVVARRDRGIAAAADLAGKKIAVTFGTSGEYNLWAFAIRRRLNPASLTLVDVAPGGIAQAIARGTVDAVVTWNPLSFDAQDALGANALVLPDDNGYAQLNVVVGQSAFLAAHPGRIAKLARALLEAEAFSRSQPEEALRMVSAWTGTGIEVLRPVWKEARFRINLRQSHLILLEDEARWAMASGHAPAGPMPNFLPHLYLDALLAARPDRVSVIR
jgi:NitT/TauT family transport system substrate-binding protein